MLHVRVAFGMVQRRWWQLLYWRMVDRHHRILVVWAHASCQRRLRLIRGMRMVSVRRLLLLMRRWCVVLRCHASLLCLCRLHGMVCGSMQLSARPRDHFMYDLNKYSYKTPTSAPRANGQFGRARQ